MKFKIILTIIFLLSIFLFSKDRVEAYSYYVNGYYRSNGTYVSGHYKTSPNFFKYDNYSYKSGQSLYNDSYYSPRSNYNYSKGWSTPSYFSTPSDYSYSSYLNRSYSTWNSGYDYNYDYDDYDYYDR